MRFIHTSDWHLGRQFHNVSLLEDQQHVLQQLINYIEEEAVDALIIAGDIYDRSVPPAAAVKLLDEVLNQLCSILHVPVIMIPGNHDSAARLRFGSRQLQQSGLHIVTSLEHMRRPVVLSGQKSGSDVEVNFYAIPYNDPEMVRHHFDADVSTHDEAHQYLFKKIHKVINDQSVNVIISHCYLDGAEATESERPLSIGGADRVSFASFLPFDYAALGHLHSPQYKGAEHIRYSGSILKYSFSEQQQKKGVYLVDMGKSGLLQTTHLPLKPLRDMRVIEGEMKTIIEQGRFDPHAHDYLMVRLTDTHAILDAMGKLREIYPNVMHLEKTGIMHQHAQQNMHKDKLRHSELAMFRDFFIQVSGHELTREQDRALQKIINSLHKSGDQ